MNTAFIDDSKIETRFVWARCAAKNARAMRDLIRAFQTDGWAAPRNVLAGKRVIRSKKSREVSGWVGQIQPFQGGLLPLDFRVGAAAPTLRYRIATPLG